MVQEDTHLAISASLVTESVLNFAHTSISRAREVVVAHGNANISIDIDLMVVKHHVGPSLATIDRKTMVLRITTLDSIIPNEVGHCFFSCWSELCVSSFGWLEQDIHMTISIKLPSGFASSSNIVPTRQVDLGDVHDSTCPCCLCALHVCFGQRRASPGT